MNRIGVQNLLGTWNRRDLIVPQVLVPRSLIKGEGTFFIITIRLPENKMEDLIPQDNQCLLIRIRLSAVARIPVPIAIGAFCEGVSAGREV